MTSRLRKKCRGCLVAKRVAGCLFDCDPLERITRELDFLMHDSATQRNPIEEQLQQCPEAFQAGELIERMFNAARFGDDEATEQEKLLPPAGAVMPPLV